MAIRLRRVDGRLIALCAARSVAQDGDVYLDDEAHEALSNKFALDNNEFIRLAFGDTGVTLPFDAASKRLIDQEESNNSNRALWETLYNGNTMPIARALGDHQVGQSYEQLLARSVEEEGERLSDPNTLTREQIDAIYGDDWYTRATWACPCGDFETSDFGTMYEYGGQCPICGADIPIKSINPDIPF